MQTGCWLGSFPKGSVPLALPLLAFFMALAAASPLRSTRDAAREPHELFVAISSCRVASEAGPAAVASWRDAAATSSPRGRRACRTRSSACATASGGFGAAPPSELAPLHTAHAFRSPSLPAAATAARRRRSGRSSLSWPATRLTVPTGRSLGDSYASPRRRRRVAIASAATFRAAQNSGASELAVRRRSQHRPPPASRACPTALEQPFVHENPPCDPHRARQKKRASKASALLGLAGGPPTVLATASGGSPARRPHAPRALASQSLSRGLSCGAIVRGYRAGLSDSSTLVRAPSEDGAPAPSRLRRSPLLTTPPVPAPPPQALRSSPAAARRLETRRVELVISPDLPRSRSELP